MFGMILEKIIIADFQKVSGEIERKVAVFGYSNLLVNCPVMLQAPYNSYYSKLLISLVELLELPQEDQILSEEQMFPEIDDNTGYQAAYSQLIFAKNKKKDPLKGEFTNFVKLPLIVCFCILKIAQFSICLLISFKK